MRISEVRWKCRKGIREVDILFSKYMEEVYRDLTVEQQKIFIEFIQQDTYEILDILVNNKPFDTKFTNLVDALKSLN
ncbi:MAG: succinate dehydrogenase assembly factor 2 [Pelagibacterales bacterium]|jgi:antitoxin CptB|nr:succinate dehydrogenase assembly factor 2 [Pelagibacterales bacterium]|tara:strand:+ start:3006 stop:3236 length:231 start_codon:yes stop_codon:yes gene_type:complete